MLTNIPREKVLEIVKEGPTIPTRISKRIGGDSMLIGAILSTLIASGDVKVSIVKIGGSPLYYIPDQEQKLEEFAHYLNEKDQKTYTILKEIKVLRDNECDPLIRVSLRNIKDYAKYFDYEVNGKKETFWRYYLTSKDEAIIVVQDLLNPKKVVEHVIEATKDSVVTKTFEPTIEIVKEKLETKPLVKETAKHHVEEKHEPTIGDIRKTPMRELEESNNAKLYEEVEEEIAENNDSTKEKHVKKPKEAVDKKETSDKTISSKEFIELVTEHIAQKKLDTISRDKIKKSEFTFVLKNHDNNDYIYCVAKDKKTINEGDLASAYVFAQNKKMPCLYLTTGKLSKKTEGILHKEFQGLIVEYLE